MSFDPSKPPLVSETLLKSRRSLEDLAFKRSLVVPALRKRKRTVRGEDIKIKRPEQFIREYRTREGSLNKVKRIKREVETRVKPTISKSDIKSTVGFVVRIHEGRFSNLEIKESLKQLGLRKKYDGCFFKLDDAGLAKLRPLDSYVAYGYLSNQDVTDLVHRRAFIQQGGPKRPLNDNLAVEKLLGSKGILCLSDLSHEIYTVGENFNEAIGILSPFELSAPVGGFEKKILGIHDEVEKHAGFIGDRIQDFVKKIA